MSCELVAVRPIPWFPAVLAFDLDEKASCCLITISPSSLLMQVIELREFCRAGQLLLSGNAAVFLNGIRVVCSYQLVNNAG